MPLATVTRFRAIHVTSTTSRRMVGYSSVSIPRLNYCYSFCDILFFQVITISPSYTTMDQMTFLVLDMDMIFVQRAVLLLIPKLERPLLNEIALYRFYRKCTIPFVYFEVYERSLRVMTLLVRTHPLYASLHRRM